MYEDVWMSSIRSSTQKENWLWQQQSKSDLKQRKNVKRIKKYRNLEKIAAYSRLHQYELMMQKKEFFIQHHHNQHNTESRCILTLICTTINTLENNQFSLRTFHSKLLFLCCLKFLLQE